MKLKVKLEALYGYGCGWGSYSSEDTIKVEVSDEIYATLKSINATEVTGEDIASAIDDGNDSLEDLDNRITQALHNMIEHYWLFESHPLSDYDSLEDYMQEDIADGTFVPPYTKEEYIRKEPIEGVYYDEKEEEEEYQNYLLDAYMAWLHTQDHDTVAIRLETDLEECLDCEEMGYTIYL